MKYLCLVYDNESEWNVAFLSDDSRSWTRGLALGGDRGAPAAAARAVQQIPKSKQHYAHHESGDSQQIHRGQLVPDVSMPGEKPEDEDHQRKAEEDPTNSHKSCSES